MRWRWVGWKVLPFGFAHVGGRELTGLLNPAVLPPSLLFPSTLGHKTYQHLSVGAPSFIARVATHRGGPAYPPLCFGFLRFPSFFFRDGYDAQDLCTGLWVPRLPLWCGCPPIARHMCARSGPCLACFRVGGFAERRPPMSSCSLRWALTCTAPLIYLRLPAKKI